MSMGASRSADRFLWALLAVAAGAVVVVAIARGRVRETQPPQVSDLAQIALPLLEGSGRASIRKGHVTVVDFWATWCAPCRDSMPRLQRVWGEYRARGVDLYSVDTDEPGGNREAEVKAFLLQNGLEFPVVLDDGSAARTFAVAMLPTMLVLDRDARVVWNHVGALTGPGEKRLREVLDRLLSKPAAAN